MESPPLASRPLRARSSARRRGHRAPVRTRPFSTSSPAPAATTTRSSSTSRFAGPWSRIGHRNSVTRRHRAVPLITQTLPDEGKRDRRNAEHERIVRHHHIEDQRTSFSLNGILYSRLRCSRRRFRVGRQYNIGPHLRSFLFTHGQPTVHHRRHPHHRMACWILRLWCFRADPRPAHNRHHCGFDQCYWRGQEGLAGYWTLDAGCWVLGAGCWKKSKIAEIQFVVFNS